MNSSRLWQGHPYPLGATWDGEGTNFALLSEHAEKVEVCLFDPNEPERELVTRRLVEPTDQVPEVTPGMRYGYRVHGPWQPEAGCRFNANKVHPAAAKLSLVQRSFVLLLAGIPGYFPALADAC